MTDEELIAGLIWVKEFEPRPAVVRICDTAIERIKSGVPGVAETPSPDAANTLFQGQPADSGGELGNTGVGTAKKGKS
jgi:hypothetical protein